MTFDAGAWWLALRLLGGLTGGFWFLWKRTVFERVDKLERSVGESVKKGDYDKAAEYADKAIEFGFDVRPEYLEEIAAHRSK